MSFFDEGYNVPKAPSGYMKLEQGINRFRILSSRVVAGYEYWNRENRPVRSREPFGMFPEDIKLNTDGTPTDIRHFWAMVVWDYKDEAIKILEITQPGIQQKLKIKIDNRGGEARKNDFIITRTGQGFNTKYDVDSTDSSPIPPEAIAAAKTKKINLDALFDGKDPFAASEDKPEPHQTIQNQSGYEKARAAANSLPSGNRPVETNTAPNTVNPVPDGMVGYDDVDIEGIDF